MKTTLLLLMISLSSTAFAGLPRMTNANPPANEPTAALQAGIAKLFPSENYREVKARVVYNGVTPDHVLVSLFVKGFHRMNFASVSLDKAYNLGAAKMNYRLQALDKANSGKLGKANCPDTSIQFLAVCPNNDSLEQNVTNDVAQAAQAAGLKTKILLLKDATTQNYVDYMSCPNLIGNFYDGDANTDVLATFDGEIENTQFSSDLKGAFRKKVTNIWLACEAYNNPMLGAVRDTDQSQKYAAGINDLQVGPSDNTAGCAMKAAIAGKAMTAAFNDCYKQFDTKKDKWGFGGDGSDYFGQ